MPDNKPLQWEATKDELLQWAMEIISSHVNNAYCAVSDEDEEKFLKAAAEALKAKSLSESSAGKLSGDVSDLLDAIVMKYRNKSAEDILKLIKLDSVYTDIFVPEMTTAGIDDMELLKYIKDSQSMYKEGLANMYMPPAIGKTDVK